MTSLNQDPSRRMAQSAKHNLCSNNGLGDNSKTDHKDRFGDSADMYRRSKSFSTELSDASGIGVHHILELPSLLEPKGLLSIYNYTVYIFNYNFKM